MKKSALVLALLCSLPAFAAETNCTAKAKWTTSNYQEAKWKQLSRSENYSAATFIDCMKFIEESAKNPRDNMINGTLGKEYPSFVRYIYQDKERTITGFYRDQKLSESFSKE